MLHLLLSEPKLAHFKNVIIYLSWEFLSDTEGMSQKKYVSKWGIVSWRRSMADVALMASEATKHVYFRTGVLCLCVASALMNLEKYLGKSYMQIFTYINIGEGNVIFDVHKTYKTNVYIYFLLHLTILLFEIWNYARKLLMHFFAYMQFVLNVVFAFVW